jgi:hypothetical protein
MSSYKVVAIDFDHTIHDTAHPKEGRRMGEPLPGVAEALSKFKEYGYRIVIHTVWSGEERHKAIGDWFAFYNLPYDEITNIKPKADAYIDDKAIRFEGDWSKVLAHESLLHK